MWAFSIRLRLKIDITHIVSHNSAKIKIDSNDNLPSEKTIIMHNVNVIVIIESVFFENHDHY